MNWDDEEEERDIRTGLFLLGQTISSGCRASQLEVHLTDGHAGATYRRRINETVPQYECTLMMLVAGRPGDDDEAVRVAEVLQKYGADVNQTSAGEIGSTPLAFAADNGKTKFLRWLIRQGARIDHRLRTSPSPPIYMSCESNHPECVAILGRAAIEQDKKWTLDATSLYGFNPAYTTFQRGFVECVGALSMCGADLRRGFALYWVPAGHTPGETAPEIDPSPIVQPQASLMQAMLSFTTLQCAHCKNISTDLNCCSRCHMAHYCSKECQREDWKFHKNCCKKLRKGQDMVYGESTSNPRPLPSPSEEQYGFDIPFAGDDFKSEENDPERPVWEYNAGSRGKADWRRYPARIEETLERMLHHGSPRYMYKPGDTEAEGKYERDRRPRAPPGVATNYVYYVDMLEREYYTGAIRAVRRNGSREPPESGGWM